MFRAQIWLRKKDGMSSEDFKQYWLEKHAPISRDGYEHLKGYVVNLVAGAPKGTDPIFDGVAELTWDSRDDFVADMKSETAAAGSEDLQNFTDGFGMVFVEQHTVK
ncbi:MAG: EthD domain-containing protein [Actinomycetota bacterium]